MIQKPPKKKKCKICREVFQPSRMIQPVCDNYECKLAYAIQHANKSKANAARAERKKTREARLRIKTKSEFLKEAQTAFNKFIRLRDHDLPCISCGRYHTGQYHAGHYRTIGSAPELRFNEQNCNKQCAPCNNHLSGNIINYRIQLINKIGIEAVEWLEGKHEPLKLSIEDIKAIKKIYQLRCKLAEKASNFGG